MLKTITRQLFARLNRHLPYRLVHRDPLPGAQTAVNATIPPSLSERCLKVAAMEQETLWRVFDTHPEGLNAAEVTRVKSMAKTAFRHRNPRRGGCICGYVIAILSTSYSRFLAAFLMPRRICLPQALSP